MNLFRASDFEIEGVCRLGNTPFQAGGWKDDPSVFLKAKPPEPGTVCCPNGMEEEIIPVWLQFLDGWLDPFSWGQAPKLLPCAPSALWFETTVLISSLSAKPQGYPFNWFNNMCNLLNLIEKTLDTPNGLIFGAL